MGGCTSTSTYNYAGDPSSSHVSSDLDFKNRPILGPCLGLTGFLNTSWSDLVLRKPQNMWIDCEYMSPTAILAHTNCKLQEAFQEVPMKAFTISNMARISSNCKFPSGKIVMGGDCPCPCLIIGDSSNQHCPVAKWHIDSGCWRNPAPFGNRSVSLKHCKTWD